jgi:hypothetical protein
MIRIITKYRFIIYQLARPFSYLRIKHDDKKIYDWIIPLILTFLSSVFSYYLIPLQNINNLLSTLTDFVANLPGFFIAALAAVATFGRHDIDELMINPPKIEILYHGNSLMIDMTRRRFLCVLFSYLTAISIFLVIGARFFMSIPVQAEYFFIVCLTGLTVFMFIFWQMITATMLGLYYLGERLHTPQQ